MKLASFEVATRVGPVRRVGVVVNDSLVDVTAGYTHVLADQGAPSPQEIAQTTAPPDMIEFLRRGDQAMTAAREVRATMSNADMVTGESGTQLLYDVDDVRLLSPLPRPNSIRDFMVFEDHVTNSLDQEIPDVWYELPLYYKGNPGSVVAPDEDVEWPSYTDKLDYELELAAIIGKQSRDITAEEADDYIAGHTIFNDFSARDIQVREMEAMLGPAKGKDFANGLGPYLATPEDINIAEAGLTARVNDEVWSEGNIGEMYHSFGDIIEHVSQDETLYPGDILGSGTIGKGCGLELDRWIQPGDSIELEVEGIGTLRHRVIKID
jgi:2-keto-4-pentenoate hydratase/2-oxohepta-3-ene-1,7-dioic acid hydratase in catechol pathway